MRNGRLLSQLFLTGLSIAALLALVATAVGDDPPAPDGLRPGGSVSENLPPPRLPGAAQQQQRERRFAQQPPIIPHDIRGYQLDRNYNRCLACHQGGGARLTGATPVSPTHYINRAGEAREELAGSRYFCTQCHVPQYD